MRIGARIVVVYERTVEHDRLIRESESSDSIIAMLVTCTHEQRIWSDTGSLSYEELSGIEMRGNICRR
uniref:Uncharacterized protein n=1 Tax=Parascaris univalens TaxID=6257 RepID=A0A914ZW57_PARUN